MDNNPTASSGLTNSGEIPIGSCSLQQQERESLHFLGCGNGRDLHPKNEALLILGERLPRLIPLFFCQLTSWMILFQLRFASGGPARQRTRDF